MENMAGDDLLYLLLSCIVYEMIGKHCWLDCHWRPGSWSDGKDIQNPEMATRRIAQQNESISLSGSTPFHLAFTNLSNFSTGFPKTSTSWDGQNTVIHLMFIEYLLISTSHRNVSINLHQHVNFFPPPFPPSFTKRHVGREASRRLEPSICFAYTSLDQLSSIDPIDPRYTHESPRSHHLPEDWPGVGGGWRKVC